MDNIRLESIVLIKSLFTREAEISYENEDFKSDININIGHNIKDDKLFVSLEVAFIAGTESNKQIDITVNMLGIFIIPKLEKKALEQFVKINAPAIIFPFIREHIANLSLKSGLQPILLPPINFIKLAKEKNN